MEENGVPGKNYENGTNSSGKANGNEEILQTQTLKIQNKRFYIDLKKNLRGKFIKVAEVAVGGRKSRILLPISTARKFSERLATFIEVYDGLVPHDPRNLAPEGGRLQSSTLVWDQRRYYLDLKENERGRFLRVTMMSPGPRCQVAIPAQGMVDFREALETLLKEVPLEEDQEKSQSDLPEPRSMRVDNRMFYFDVGANRRGTFLRISEVRPDCRTAITLPSRSWPRFQEILEAISNEVGGLASAAAADGETAAPAPSCKEEEVTQLAEDLAQGLKVDGDGGNGDQEKSTSDSDQKAGSGKPISPIKTEMKSPDKSTELSNATSVVVNGNE